MLPPPVTVKEKSTVNTRTSLAIDLMKEEEITLHSEPVESKKTAPAQVVSLTPPQALFQPMEYPPLHIFVS